MIRSENLFIVPFSEKHLSDEYVSWLNDPEVVKFSEQRHRSHNLDSCRSYYESNLNTDNLLLAIEEKNNRTHIGNITISKDLRNGVADISIMIGNRNFWGKSLGKESFVSVVEHLKADSKIRKITAGTIAANEPMVKLMAAAGMEIEAVLKNHYLLDGNPVDLVLGALIKEN